MYISFHFYLIFVTVFLGLVGDMGSWGTGDVEAGGRGGGSLSWGVLAVFEIGQLRTIVYGTCPVIE